MADVRLSPPLSEADIRPLRVGDWVTLDGTVLGVRDATLIRIFDHGQAPPIDLRGAMLLHTAPNVRKVGKRYEPLSVGTTTSTRMDRFTEPLLRAYGVRGFIGKGGLLEGSVRAMAEYGAVYLTIVGGAAAWQTLHIEAIEAVYWEDLMPECLWHFTVRDLGPLLVSIDSHGASTYADVKRAARQRLPGLLAKGPSREPASDPGDPLRGA